MDRGEIYETAAFTMVAVAVMGLIYYLYYFSPVTYVRLITEDQWGEYVTAVYYALAGVLLLMLARRPGPLSRRVLWGLGGIFALLIFAEEISWGQRIFKYPIPAPLRAMNVQGEFNLHNVGYLDELNREEGLHRGAGIAVLAWSLLSLTRSLWKPRLAAKIREIGLPVIPVRLLPMFLLVPYFFVLRPVFKPSEIGELLLGMAVAFWAADLFFRYGAAEISRRKKAALMAGFFALTVFLSAAMTWAFPGSLKMRLNLAAARYYPSRGMHEQAESLFRYIYDRPEYLLPETRINHGRMLIETGQRERGIMVLEEAEEVVEEVFEEAKAGPGNVPAFGERGEEFANPAQVIHALLEQAAPVGE